MAAPLPELKADQLLDLPVFLRQVSQPVPCQPRSSDHVPCELQTLIYNLCCRCQIPSMTRQVGVLPTTRAKGLKVISEISTLLVSDLEGLSLPTVPG